MTHVSRRLSKVMHFCFVNLLLLLGSLSVSAQAQALNTITNLSVKGEYAYLTTQVAKSHALNACIATATKEQWILPLTGNTHVYELLAIAKKYNHPIEVVSSNTCQTGIEVVKTANINYQYSAQSAATVASNANFVARATFELAQGVTLDSVSFGLSNNGAAIQWKDAVKTNDVYTFDFGLLAQSNYKLTVKASVGTVDVEEVVSFKAGVKAIALVYTDTAGNLYIEVNGSYLKLSKDTNGTWTVTAVSAADWQKLTLIPSEFNFELGDFSGDSLEDIKLTNADGTVNVVFENSNDGYVVKAGEPELYTFTSSDFAKTNDTQRLELPTKGAGNIIASTPGQFRVDESGNATYQVPFNLPIGPAGIRPELGLGYSSANTRTGFAGVGWSLSGMSSISRCGKSHYYDDLGDAFVEDISFTADDAFCVDGQRLIEVSAGVYRTEQDSFTEYTANISGADIIGFTAETKSGETHYYGNKNNATTAVQSINSSVTGNVAVALTWLRSSIVDTHGNTINYQFKTINNTDELILDKVTYGPVTVTVHSEDKPEGQKFDRQYGYRYGQKYQQTQRLAGVTVAVSKGGSHFANRYYDIGYSTTHNRLSYIDTITECIAENTHCAKPVTFNWSVELGGGNVTLPTFSGSNPVDISTDHNGGYTRILDFNGDGISDFIEPKTDTSWQVTFGKKSREGGYTTETVSLSGSNNQDNYAFEYAKVVDINGDGRQDLLIPSYVGTQTQWHGIFYSPGVREVNECETESGHEYLCSIESKAHTLIGELVLPAATADAKDVNFADINGDGLLDMTYKITLSDKTSPQKSGSISSKIHVNLNQSIDVNAGTTNNYFAAIKGIYTSPTDGSDGQSEIKDLVWLDANGDGLTDILVKLILYKLDEMNTCNNGEPCLYPNGSKTVLLLNQGGQFTSHDTEISSLYKMKLADFNGDGMADILYPSSGTVRISTGEGFMPGIVVEALKGLEEKDYMLMDFDMDGHTDLLTYNNNNNSSWFVKRFNPTTKGFEASNAYGLQSSFAFEKKDTDIIQYGDFDGDGALDWARLRDNKWSLYYRINTSNSKNNVIKHFIDGMGNQTGVTYKPLTDSSVYEGTVEVRFPLISVTNPVYVVSEATSPDGTGTQASVKYKYANMALHGQGRGYLGFAKLTTIDGRDETYDMVTETYYNQGFDASIANPSELSEPEFIGMPTKTRQSMIKKDGTGSILLSEAVNEYKKLVTVDALDTSAPKSPYFTYIEKSTEKAYHLSGGANGVTYTDGGIKSTTTTTNGYDATGNLTSSEVILKNADDSHVFKTTSTNSYLKGGGSCAAGVSDYNTSYIKDYARFGRLTCSAVSKTVTKDNLSTTQSRMSGFGYNAQGILNTEITALGSDQQVTTEYTFNAKGNIETKTVSGKALIAGGNSGDNYSTTSFSDAISRTQTMKYDADQRFMTSQSNDLGYTTCFNVNSVTGLVTSKTTNVASCDDAALANGFTTVYRYNAFGQATATQTPNGLSKLINRSWVNASQPQLGYSETVTSSTGLPSTSYFDNLGRAYKVKSNTYNANKYQYAITQFDEFGRTHKQSIPLSTETVTATQWQTSEFDILGRTISQTTPSFNGSALTVTTTYDKYSQTQVHSDGTKKVKKVSTFNVAGELVNTIDNADAADGATASSIAFTYDAYGKLLTTTDSLLNVIQNTYDSAGNKITMNDPDKGLWTYKYNAFGELKWQESGNKTVTWFNYDTLGRVIQRIDNATGASESRCFMFDGLYQGAKDSERVVKGASCRVDSKVVFEKQYGYDTLARLESTTTDIYHDDAPTVSQYQRNYYDGLSRVYMSQLSNDYAVGYQFNANGIKTSEHSLEFDAASNTVNVTELKKIVAVNYRGQVTEEQFLGNQTIKHNFDANTGLEKGFSTLGIANGSVLGELNASYAYNAFGQLKQRDINSLYDATRTDEYQYDGLNRLKQTAMRYGAQAGADNYYCYDAIGNMLQKEGAKACDAKTNHFSYGNTARSKGNAGPHALRTDTNTGRNFSYDNNGNLQTDGNRNFIYSAFDKVTQISQNANMQVNFRYGAGLSRYFRKDTYLAGNGAGLDTEGERKDTQTHYFGAFERIQKLSDNGNAQLSYQYAVGNIMITKDVGTGVISRKLMVRDHLGSVLAVTSNAKVVQAFYYKAFGEQVDMTENAFGPYKRYARQGYTGHEMLNGLNVIHMNGRIYDPTLGRFLQADPNIQAPSNSQSYNRYSYVLNNPMSYTDPSGYFFKALGKFVKKYGRMIVAAVAAYYTFGLATGWVAAAQLSAGAAALGGAAAGFVSGAIMTGSLKGAATGALTGAVMGGIGASFSGAEGFLASGAVGGVMSDLQGGKFGHGFWSAGLGSATGGQYSSNAPVQVLVAAVVGGTISKLTGGKFANGAVGAAFAAALRADWGDKLNKKSPYSSGPVNLTEEQLNDINAKIKELQISLDKKNNSGGFLTMDDAAKWYHNNIQSLSEKYDMEIGARIFKNDMYYDLETKLTSTRYFSGNITTNYAHNVTTISNSTFGSFSPIAEWHSHGHSNVSYTMPTDVADVDSKVISAAYLSTGEYNSSTALWKYTGSVTKMCGKKC
ncbi:toxin TcdB middle/N-terminal domain-containing protein [Pseudoalteromonas denitrificans]|uniref:RHS repeat-associated core domain-containing protein n=1 Tax=Pseudoalteromonas denitrificans DSM 6059 TaxID=1123010 RepID=A0A1I1MWD3_9GAMM|nr:toxin TcdB middle/N-terminal domain-containing protein [Pseudoalteromonas denitrificans]SFC89679.1 RHS repeat-associated core domain-containing protein [Pseudoalteromonas denitrificans DSM 6059]